VLSKNRRALLTSGKPCFPAIAAETPYPTQGTPLHVLGWGSTDSDNTQPAYNLMVWRGGHGAEMA